MKGLTTLVRETWPDLDYKDKGDYLAGQNNAMRVSAWKSRPGCTNLNFVLRRQGNYDLAVICLEFDWEGKLRSAAGFIELGYKAYEYRFAAEICETLPKIEGGDQGIAEFINKLGAKGLPK